MSIQEIRVSPIGDDPRAEELRYQAAQMLGIDIDVVTTRVFRAEGVSEDEARKLADELFTDPVTETSEVGTRKDWDNSCRVEVDYKAGVMNPEEASIERGANLLGIEPTAIGSATEYSFATSTPPELVAKIINGLLVNKTVQHIRDKSPESLRISGRVTPTETVQMRDLDTNQLEDLSKNVAYS